MPPPRGTIASALGTPLTGLSEWRQGRSQIGAALVQGADRITWLDKGAGRGNARSVRLSPREPGVDDVDEPAPFEGVVPQDALAYEARRFGETLHRSILRKRVQLYPVQTELALPPPNQ